MKSIIKYTLLSLFLFAHTGIAQQYSIYSRFGLGAVEHSNNSRSMGMGGFGVADVVSDYISPLNPASWGSLSTTRFQFGTVLIGNIARDNNLSNFATQAYFSGFAFAFPVSTKNGIGVSLGILPFTTVNYKMKITGTDTRINSDYTQEANGQGGLAKLYVGSSWTPVGDFRLGASLNYYFGKLSYNNKINFLDGVSLKTDYTKSYRMKGVGIDAGIITPELSEILGIQNIIPGLKLGLSVSTFNEFTSDSLFAGGNNIVIDTLNYGAGSMQLPMKLSFGIALQLNRSMRVVADFSSQAWSAYTNNGFSNADLQDMYRVGSGFEYRVKDRDRNFDSYIYRGSLFYEKSPYIIKGESITELGAGVGVSFSLSPESYFDLGLQYIARGTTNNNLVQENIFRLNVGMSLGEIWFIQQER